MFLIILFIDGKVLYMLAMILVEYLFESKLYVYLMLIMVYFIQMLNLYCVL